MAKSQKKSDSLSPMMTHYKEVKAQYPDTIIMYRLGDFYEMFFDDAIEVSKLLDLTLTGRDCGLKERAPMCGVPYHAVDNYISRLIKSGKKVAICEQLTAPGDQKGMVKRDVIRVITPGTVTDDEMLDATSNSYLMSFYKGKNGEFGMAWADVSTGEVKVSEPAGGVEPEDFVLSIAPSEIISNEAGAAFLNSTDSVALGKLPRAQAYYEYSFSHDNAVDTVTAFYNVYNLAALGLEAGAGVSALGALLNYITSTQKRKLDHLTTPALIRHNGGMFIDYNTRRNLELTETIFDKSKTGSLLWVLDHTRTNMGARAVRRAVLEPLADEKSINKRLDAVEELYKAPTVREALGEALNEIRDIERLCNKIAYNSINPRETQAVGYSLKQLPYVKRALAKAKSSALKELAGAIDPLDAVTSLLESAIVDAPPTTVKDGGVFRTGYNAELDAFRTAQTSAKAWLAEYEAKEREATGIKQLKVGYNRVFGYYIEVSNSNLPMVPYRFERKQTLTTGERFITDELKKMEEVILGAEEKALQLEEKLYGEIKRLLSDVMSVLQRNARSVAEIDMIYSLATAAAKGGYCRPSIKPLGADIVIKNGRHPVVEALKGKNKFVPNDAVMTDDSRLLIVTGPNMAGKSTYMRQIALIVLMAHIGSFVPAEEATIGLVDRVFTRVGASDNVAYGQSTFMVEMTEMANILNNATSNSLLILDEIGRGTSTLDGLSIAWAIVEHISLKLKAKTLFATHYHELSELENTLPALKNYHVLIKDTGGEITFLYKIARGGANKSFGIEVASLAGINPKITERARNIMRAIESSSDGSMHEKVTAMPGEDAVISNQIGLFPEDDRYSAISGVLNDTDCESITPIQALTILSNLKEMVKNDGKKRKKK